MGNDLYYSDSDLDEMDFEDTMESMFNSDAELHFDDARFVGERKKMMKVKTNPCTPKLQFNWEHLCCYSHPSS